LFLFMSPPPAVSLHLFCAQSMVLPYPYFKCLKSSNIFFLQSPCFASIQRNTPNKCLYHMFLQVKAEVSSHEVSFFCLEPLSQSSLPSYFVTTSTVFGHQTSEVHNKLFICFQILSIHCDLHSSSFYHRHFYDFSFLHVDSHGMSSYEI